MKLINKITNTDIRKRFFNAILFGIGGVTVSKALLMLFNVITARLLGETQYGVYSIINNTVQTFTAFAGVGIGVTITRYVALYRDKDTDMTGIVIKTLLLFNSVLSAIVGIIIFILSENISNLLSEQINISFYLKITAGTIFFTSVALILQGILQGFEEYKKIAFVQIVSNILMLIIGVFATRILGITGTVIALLILQVIPTILFFLMIKNILSKKRIKTKFEINDTIKKAIKNVAIPAFLSSVFVMPLLWTTNFIFTNKNGYQEFAAFSVCLQWYTILKFLPQQLAQVRPIYTQLYSENKMGEFKKVVKRLIQISIGFVSIATLVLMGASYFLLKIYGDFYTTYIVSFNIMLVASIFYTIPSQYGNILQAIGRTWLSFLLNFIWAVCFFIFFILLYSKGAIGYAITYIVSYMFYSIISVIVFYRTVKDKNIESKEEIDINVRGEEEKMKNNKYKELVCLVSHCPDALINKRLKMLKERYKVTVIYNERGNENFCRVEGINYIKLSLKFSNEHFVKRVFYLMKLRKEIRQTIKNINPTIIYAFRLDMLFMVLINGFKNKKIIYEVADLHKVIINDTKNIIENIARKILRFIEKKSLENVDILSITSERFYDAYFYKYIDKSKVVYMPNIPDYQCFKNYRKNENKEFTVGFIGFVRYKRQMELLIQAAEKGKINVFFAGASHQDDEIEKMAQKCKYIEYYGKYDYDKEIASLYAKCDCIFAVYDLSYNNIKHALPNKLYESVYCELPILVTKDTYTAQLVEEWGVGLTVEWNSLEDLIEKINTLRNDKELYINIVNNCKKVKEKMDIKQYNDAFMKKVEQL